MVLGLEKTRAFYALLSGLANFVNAKYNLHPEVMNIDYNLHDAAGTEKARYDMVQTLWDRPEYIDEYLAEGGAALPEKDKETIASWKRYVRGRFVLERALKSGGVLLGPADDDDACGYLVQNFMLEWSDTVIRNGLQIPLYVRTTLLPYDGVIVTDGFTEYLPIFIGGGLKKIYKEAYSELKKEGRVLKTL